jgi:hypothetical protein
MRGLMWLSTFVIATPLALVSAFFLLVSFSPRAPEPPTNSPQVLAAYTSIYEPQAGPISHESDEIVQADARPLIVKNYLAKYNSPLEPFHQLIIDISDKYSLDYRLLVAIAQQESNLCKKIPDNSYNCWGFGIYGDKVTRFGSYPEGLETVAKTLKFKYIDQGLDTPEEIMVRYTPPSLEKGGSWAKGVNQFFSEME